MSAVKTYPIFKSLRLSVREYGDSVTGCMPHVFYVRKGSSHLKCTVVLRAEPALTDEHYLERLPQMNCHGDKVNPKGIQWEVLKLTL